MRNKAAKATGVDVTKSLKFFKVLSNNNFLDGKTDGKLFIAKSTLAENNSLW